MTHPTPMDCLKLIDQAYAGAPGGQKLDNQKAFVVNGRAEAYLTHDGVLVIPGSQSAEDYTRFNLRLMSWKNAFNLRNYKFHYGFLSHATLLKAFVRDNDVRFVTGHSLGAASAQILGAWYDLPGYLFASPRVLRKRYRAVKGTKLISFNRVDDSVCTLPGRGFNHIGQVYELNTGEVNVGMDHSTSEYRTAMRMANVQAAVPVRFA